MSSSTLFSLVTVRVASTSAAQFVPGQPVRIAGCGPAVRATVQDVVPVPKPAPPTNPPTMTAVVEFVPLEESVNDDEGVFVPDWDGPTEVMMSPEGVYTSQGIPLPVKQGVERPVDEVIQEKVLEALAAAAVQVEEKIEEKVAARVAAASEAAASEAARRRPSVSESVSSRSRTRCFRTSSVYRKGKKRGSLSRQELLQKWARLHQHY